MTVVSVNPHDPADVIGEWPTADEAELSAVVGRATAAARDWANVAAPARSAALGAAADALAARSAEVTGLVIREVGKSRSEAAGEVARGIAILRYYAQAALLPDGETIHHDRALTGAGAPCSHPAVILLRLTGQAASAGRPGIR